MTRLRGRSAPRRTLRDAVRRAHLGMTLTAVALSGAMLLLAGLAALRFYVDDNLQLIARSLAYTVEAAVVFDDREDADQTLRRMLPDEGVAQAVVRDAQGEVFARWRGPDQGVQGVVGACLVRLAALPPSTAAILHEGRPIGEVVLRSDGLGLLQFLLRGAAALVACLLLSGFVGTSLSRRMLHDLVTPLQQLADVARTMRRGRSHGLRVPPARIDELRALGDDFNALLDELERREVLLEQKNAALTHEATHDKLTGLPNRAYFEQRLQDALLAAQRTRAPLALLFLDSDRFKQVNDTHGHAAGDLLLATTARRIAAQLRAGDLAARLGGDEFAIVMTPLHDRQDAMHLADRVIAAMAEPVALPDGACLRPSVSIGVAVYPDHGADLATLLRAADAAMYRVKARHRGGCRMAADPASETASASAT